MNKFKNEHRRKRLATRIVNYFLRGLLIGIPLAATLAGIIWLFNTIDGLLGRDHVPGLGVVIVFGTILLIGMIGSSVILQPFISWFDEWLERTPGVKFLYSSVKDIVGAFVGEKKKFSKPVMVEMNGEGIYKIGFVTIKDLTKINLEGYSGVYFPKSYGFMGDLYLVDNKKIKPLDANPTMVFKMIVSGGVTGFEGQDA